MREKAQAWFVCMCVATLLFVIVSGCDCQRMGNYCGCWVSCAVSHSHVGCNAAFVSYNIAFKNQALRLWQHPMMCAFTVTIDSQGRSWHYMAEHCGVVFVRAQQCCSPLALFHSAVRGYPT